jgi:hypothetical protein
MNMKPVLSYIVPVLAAGCVSLAAFVLLARPDTALLERVQSACSEPVTYAVAAYDPRFGISRAEFEDAIEDAAAVWNEEGRRLLLASSSEPIVSVNLAYDERQQALELGGVISAEQQNYEDLREGIETLKARYTALQVAYETSRAAFEAEAASYEQAVETWNARGGAPPAVYAQLALRKAALEERQADLNRQGVLIESVGRDINLRVDSLNALVRRLNANAETFNETLGHDFDQGNYVSDEEGRRITIFTFEDKEELTRVLAHEFGHALGIGHVEDPDSIMYSYSIGQTLTLSEEDKAALKEACDL